MKIKKTAALLLALVLAFGAAAGCAGMAMPARPPRERRQRPRPSRPRHSRKSRSGHRSPPSGRQSRRIFMAPAADVKDEDTTPIVIYSWNHDFKDLSDTYYVPGHPGFQYEYHVVDESRYQAVLESVLSSGRCRAGYFPGRRRLRENTSTPPIR